VLGKGKLSAVREQFTAENAEFAEKLVIFQNKKWKVENSSARLSTEILRPS